MTLEDSVQALRLDVFRRAQELGNVSTQAPCGGGHATALVVPPLVWIGGRSRRRKS